MGEGEGAARASAAARAGRSRSQGRPTQKRRAPKEARRFVSSLIRYSVVVAASAV